MSDSNPYGQQPPQEQPGANPYGYPQQGAQPGYGAAPGQPGQPPQGGQPNYGYPYPGSAPAGGGYPPQPQPGMPVAYDPMAPYGYDPYGRPYSDKSKMTAGLLGIFLGTFGVGRFYTGHTGLAVGQLLVGVLTCGIGGMWGFIDGIVMLAGSNTTDAQGRILRS
ncbi:TM2 domain-containing protein [Streptomyces kunmingensis]|uniref:TM2 domain-containing protein n=1 Tax=Streptomyces kunmingensis TaxID=68225 RepID=A0ABU6CPW5_9ACTN|nr:TM2 domain-containing protein [Streptomyces kunmingensis]MEB3966261.1 TM2 domain-containing protein [Streptomyces kunmingensis]